VSSLAPLMHDLDVQCIALHPCQVTHAYPHFKSWWPVQ